MGFFKSIRDLTAVANEVQRTQPPAQERLAGAMASIKDLTATMGAIDDTTRLETELRATGMTATAIVASVSDALGAVNGAPLLELGLTVQVPGLPPRPATVRAVVPGIVVHKVLAGSTVPVLVSPSGDQVALDSAALQAG
jgi:hypothetical protein